MHSKLWSAVAIACLGALVVAALLLPQSFLLTAFSHLIDFILLTLWWIYLYIFIVIPWQYVVTNELAYGWNLNAVYLFEKLAFLIALSGAWIRSKGRWRVFYGHLFGASLTYAAGSYVANWALTRNGYYSGSLYDIPLVASMAWITLIGVWTRG